MYAYPYYMAQDDRTYVADRNEAEAFLVAPNQIVHLWHRTEPIIYEKQTDGRGVAAPLVIIRYTRETVKTKEQEYEERIQALEAMVQKLGGQNDAE